MSLHNGTITTIAGNGKPGLLNEPGGLCILGQFLYVADTNNHAIRRIRLSTRKMDTLSLTFPYTIPQEGTPLSIDSATNQL
jgi:hypothetical protein